MDIILLNRAILRLWQKNLQRIGCVISSTITDSQDLGNGDKTVWVVYQIKHSDISVEFEYVEQVNDNDGSERTMTRLSHMSMSSNLEYTSDDRYLIDFCICALIGCGATIFKRSYHAPVILLDGTISYIYMRDLLLSNSRIRHHVRGATNEKESCVPSATAVAPFQACFELFVLWLPIRLLGFDIVYDNGSKRQFLTIEFPAKMSSNSLKALCTKKIIWDLRRFGLNPIRIRIDGRISTLPYLTTLINSV